MEMKMEGQMERIILLEEEVATLCWKKACMCGKGKGKGVTVLGMPPLASPRYCLRSSSSSRSSTRFATTRSLPYDFMPMPGLPPSLSPSRLYATSSLRLQSRRWEGVLYSVWFVFPCPSSLALGTSPEEQDFSLKFAGVLSLAGLAVTGTVNFRL